MVDLMVVREALKRSWALDSDQKLSPGNSAEGQDTLISSLIHDVFGGEILKTHKRRGWHFYNRIEGLRIDFTRLEIDKSYKGKVFEDLPSSPDETSSYFAPEDYSTFFMRFVKAFEEAVGLKKSIPGFIA